MCLPFYWWCVYQFHSFSWIMSQINFLCNICHKAPDFSLCSSDFGREDLLCTTSIDIVCPHCGDCIQWGGRGGIDAEVFLKPGLI